MASHLNLTKASIIVFPVFGRQGAKKIYTPYAFFLINIALHSSDSK